ncbi:hypothetical protein EZV62_004465 [Acer yangbiense]|uniref:Cation efflux protein transmembrane domain-containing protein n=1 Tax=Acer yangbiense TaxID=1000413 RepID=A0A5C7IJZ5_9ROSI|nr:hypothetical protein EZV62_004465 [Acer yangbiense]
MMQSSHRLLSRLLHSTKRTAVSNPSLLCNVFYNDHGVFVSPMLHFTTAATNSDQKKIFNFLESQFRGFSSVHGSKRFTLFSLVSLQINDGHQHHQYSSHRSKFFFFFFLNLYIYIYIYTRLIGADFVMHLLLEIFGRGRKSKPRRFPIVMNTGLNVLASFIEYKIVQRAVTTALCGNFLVFALKFGVWLATSSHVMLAEAVHSIADFANQALLAYGLISSRRAPDALHPYGYSKERFVWSLISAVGIFCLGSGATIVHGIQNLWSQEQPENIKYAALVIGGSLIIEGASLFIAIQAVQKGAAAEGMKVRDYIWRGHDPTSVAVMTEDSAAVAGLLVAGASLLAVNTTRNPVYDAVGSIVVGNLLGLVAIFLIQRNRHSLIGRAMDDNEMEKILRLLKNDPVVDSLYDCKSEVIGPGFYRFKAEIDFNGEKVVQNYLKKSGRTEWATQFRKAARQNDDYALVKTMSDYGEELVTALGSEVDRLEREIREINPGIRHVDIEVHNPADLS